jgi:choline dehydrogenase-like flavoprotein
MCGLIVMVSDKGMGRVRATATGRAAIEYNFDPGDLERVKQGMIISAAVLQAGGAKDLMAPVHGVGRHKTVDSFAAALTPRKLRDFILYAAHPMSTCRMGRNPSTSVVDSRGKVHGIEGLYIADASLFPTSLGVNPQLTTMAVGTLLARRWLAEG